MKNAVAAMLSVIIFLGASCSVVDTVSQRMQDSPATTLFIIDQGVSRFIEAEDNPEKRVKRAQATRSAVQPVYDALSQDTNVTVASLEAVLFAQFDISSMEPSDQRLIRFLVADVKQSLSEAVVGNIIDEQDRVALAEVLNTILMAAVVYGG